MNGRERSETISKKGNGRNEDARAQDLHGKGRGGGIQGEGGKRPDVCLRGGSWREERAVSRDSREGVKSFASQTRGTRGGAQGLLNLTRADLAGCHRGGARRVPYF